MIARMLKILGISSVAVAVVSFAVLAQTASQPTPAAPQTAPATPKPMAACRADMKALCGSVEPGKGAKVQCLVENKSKASVECQTAMVQIQERAAKRAENKGGKGGRFAACRGDIASLCPEATKGKERAQCLRENAAKVSSACGEALAATPIGKRDPGRAAMPDGTPSALPPVQQAPKPQ